MPGARPRAFLVLAETCFLPPLALPLVEMPPPATPLLLEEFLDRPRLQALFDV